MRTPIRFALRAIAATTLATTLVSCNAPMTVAPIGTQPVPLEPKEWDGRWISVSGDAMYTVRVIDPTNGKAIVTEEHFEPFTVDGPQVAYLRSHGNWQFLSGTSVPKPDQKDQPSRYYYGRALRLGDELLVWEPNEDAIAELIRREELPSASPPGTPPEKRSTDLGKLNEAQLQRLTRDPEEGLFSTKARRYIRIQPGEVP